MIPTSIDDPARVSHRSLDSQRSDAAAVASMAESTCAVT